MRLRWAASIVLVLAATTSSAAPAARQAPIVRKADMLDRVNAAIDRGVAWLKEAQREDGSFARFPMYPGATTALAYMTLRVCGLPPTSAPVKAAWASLRRDYSRKDLATYAAAVYLLAIAEHGERVQGARDEHDVKLTKDDQKWAEEIVRFLVEVQDAEGRFNYEGVAHVVENGQSLSQEWDNSNSQYALLGLKAAARCGVTVGPEVWRKSLEHFLRVQQTQGPEVARGLGPSRKGATRETILDHARGWTYRDRPDAGSTSDGAAPTRPAYTGMTAGGVSSLVICRSELIGSREFTPKLDADSERAIWDGLAWIGVNWAPDAEVSGGADLKPDWRDAMGRGIWPYELYGVERAGVLAGVEWMGTRDWYGEGAAALLSRQLADGSWTGFDGGLIVNDLAARKRAFRVADTCFALLFLKRGTVPVAQGAITSGGDEEDIDFAAAAKLAGKDLEDFLDLVIGRWRRTDDPDVKERLFDGVAQAGRVIVEPLLLRMESSDAARREAAGALIAHVTGLDFGYAGGASPERREEALVRWQMWWMSNKDRVRYDASTKRLVAR